jgi:hypothetical protein
MTKASAPQMATGANRNTPLQLNGFAGLPLENYPGTVSKEIFDIPMRRNFEFANAIGNPALNRPLSVAGGLLLEQIDASSRT